MAETKPGANPKPWKFFSLVFLLTWVCWIPAGLSIVEESPGLTQILHYAGGVMPTLAALWLLYRSRSPDEQKNYWRRLVDFKRIKPAWYAVIFLTVPILTAIGVLFDLLLGGQGGKPAMAAEIIQSPLSLLPFALFMLVFGPLPEEMAWRGYALDGLQLQWNAFTSSLILGTAWTVWHLPLFFISGSYQQGLGIGTTTFWLYMLDKIPQSVLMTWIYNNNQRSTLSAVLIHFMVNFTGELLDLSQRGEMIYIAAWWILAATVVIIWKPQKLVRSQAQV